MSECVSKFTCLTRLLAGGYIIDPYYWLTPNGLKVTIFLREIGLEYLLHPINIGKGAQFDPKCLSMSPNNRILAIIDNELEGGGESISVLNLVRFCCTGGEIRLVSSDRPTIADTGY